VCNISAKADTHRYSQFQKGGNQCWLMGGHVTKRRKQGNYSQVGVLDLLLKREDFAICSTRMQSLLASGAD